MDSTDYWLASNDKRKHPITEPFLGDLPSPEWIAFGDPNSPRILYMLHHEDDQFPDNYVSRPDMTVLGFGRKNKDKYLSTIQTFSIGFVESTNYKMIDQTIKEILDYTREYSPFIHALKLLPAPKSNLNVPSVCSIDLIASRILKNA